MQVSPPVVNVDALPGQELKHMTNLEILEADLNNSSHAEAVRQLLDEYARLPIGQGAPLTAQVLERLVPRTKSDTRGRWCFSLGWTAAPWGLRSA